MATESIHNDMRVITVDAQEAVNFIGLLVAQLGSKPLTGNASGAAPTINIVEDGVVKYRLLFLCQTK